MSHDPDARPHPRAPEGSASGDEPGHQHIDRRRFLRGVGALSAVAAGGGAVDSSLLAPSARDARPDGPNRATTYAIHPAVGVARVGNAPATLSDPSSWYLGAEAPGEVPNEGQAYKTGGRLKKQAQRFRIYQFEDGVATREITLDADDVTAIQWTVSVGNRKAALNLSGTPGSKALPRVRPPEGEWGDNADRYGPAETRNADVPEAQRGDLCIESGPQSVGGGQSQADLAGRITFNPPSGPMSKDVALGRIHSEPGSGRLLVFAGDGMSEGCPDGTWSQLPTIKEQNNDYWHDDTFDGWVQAEITFANGTTVTLDQPHQRAWVIASVPRYVPSFSWFTSLYDIGLDATRPTSAPPPRPSFARDIYPLLRSASLLQWVTARAAMGHGTGRGGGYYLSQSMMELLADPNADPQSDAYMARHGVFTRIRPPDMPLDLNTVQQYMPQVPNDITRNPTGHYAIAKVTRLQYGMLRRWRDGDFEADGFPTYQSLDAMPVREQPAALDRAALENTAGTPFYPGIESWRIMASPDCYLDSVFRISDEVEPGDLTIGNALPWQGDFLDCSDIWWPVQRPNEVTRNGENLQRWVPIEWLPDEDNPQFTQMVLYWWQLGFVVSRDGGVTYEDVESTAGNSGS